MEKGESGLLDERCLITEFLTAQARSAAQLYTDEYVEIDLLVSGRGTHRVLDRMIPCGEGELCVLYPRTSHGYESDGEEPVTILRILFDPKQFLSGDFGDPEHQRFCYGAFCEGAVVSYAKLNKKSRGTIEPLFQSVFEETETKRMDWQNVVGAYLSVLLVMVSRYVNGTIRNPSSNSKRDRELVMSASLRRCRFCFLLRVERSVL